MKRFCLISASLLLFIEIGLFGCSNVGNIRSSNEECQLDSLVQYRDTIVGKFNGIDIDTLICEPTGKLIKDELFGEFYTEWRVYTTRGTVEELKIGNTIGIEFVKEGDLDGNKTEEWGFMTQWPTSSWTVYELFVFDEGKWKLMVEPIRIWRDHLETSFSESDIAQPSSKKGYIQIKTSVVIDDVTNWIVVDTIVPINPKAYSYELVEW